MIEESKHQLYLVAEPRQSSGIKVLLPDNLKIYQSIIDYALTDIIQNKKSIIAWIVNCLLYSHIMKEDAACHKPEPLKKIGGNSG